MKMKITKMTGKSGDELKEGIYYYIINPESKKYNYNSTLISGYVHLIRNE